MPDIDSEKVQLGPWLGQQVQQGPWLFTRTTSNWTIASDKNSMHVNNWKNMPKIDTLDALGDAITTILATNLDNNIDNQS